ncbi:MAG: hypothetical protein ACR2JM_01285 [Mycobacterium sp.]
MWCRRDSDLRPPGYAVWTAKGKISIPIWKGREWGVGKMLTKAAVYAAITAGLGYLAWSPWKSVSAKA